MSWYWGIDVGSHAVHIAGLADDGSQLWTREVSIGHKRFRDGQRLYTLRTAVYRTIEEIRPMTPATAAIVELPVGTFPNPSLMMSAGAVLDALWDTHEVATLTLNPTSWKKELLGRGNASKEDIMAYAKRELGYRGLIQDEADALCLAELCRRRFT